MANLEAKGAYWASMRAFQTRDESLNRNLKTDVTDGEILSGVDSEITEVKVTTGDLAFFTQQHQKWMQNRDEMTFSYEVMRGERLPAGTPLGSARLAASMAGGHFDHIRENIALDIKEFLYEVIIPNFQKEQKKEHTLRIVGQDLDTLNELLVNERATRSLALFVARRQKLPSNLQYKALKAVAKAMIGMQKERLVSIPKDFYKDLECKIDIIITGEQKDTAVYSQTLFAALQAVTVDPTLLSDPTKKKFFFKWLEAGGVHPADFAEIETTPQLSEMAMMQAPRSVGGGVSRPNFPAPGGAMTGEARI
jgi:hypothetical protein